MPRMASSSAKATAEAATAETSQQTPEQPDMVDQKMRSALMEKEMLLAAANQSAKQLSLQLADQNQLAEDTQRLLQAEQQKTSSGMKQRSELEHQLKAKQASIDDLQLQKQLDVNSQVAAARVQELQGISTLAQVSAHEHMPASLAHASLSKMPFVVMSGHCALALQSPG